jgi:N-methylhydantoinase A
MSVRLGVDVGGTFTDLVAIDETTNSVTCMKVPSTPGDPIAGVINSIEMAGIRFVDIQAIVHGTTVATNALVERKGAPTGFICTAGFRDIIFIQRMNRKHHYDLSWDKPVLPAARRNCFDVRERFNVDGVELIPFDRAGARAVAEKIRERGLQAVAVCFLFSFKNGAHELAMRDVLAEVCPDVEVTLSHEVYPRWREYERASTSIIDAYLKPLVGGYIRNVSEGLKSARISANLLLSKSNGGVTEAAAISGKPVDLILSGPVGGVLAAAQLGRITGRKNLISTDMGGTSFDVSMIIDGHFGRSQGIELEWGVPIRTGMVSVETIGTGGGSIARIDGGGFLRVGPESAGAWPGPACYGRGGTFATVSDANLVLGRLNPDNFAGGQMRLDPDAAKTVVGVLAAQLGADLHKVAHDIIELSNWNMVNAIRLVSIDKGKDPRDFTLVAFGGAGAAHAAALSETLGMREAMIPVYQGVLSAYGLTSADMRVDVSQTTNLRSDYFDLASANTTMKALMVRALRHLRTDGFSGDPISVVTFEMRYLGQNYSIEIPVPFREEGVDAQDLRAVFDGFHRRHRQLYGYSIEQEVIEITDFNATAIGLIPKPDLPRIRPTGAVSPRSHRLVYFEEAGGFVECSIYERADICADTVLEGPAIIEEEYSLTLLPPHQRMNADEWGNLYITRARTPSGLLEKIG